MASGDIEYYGPFQPDKEGSITAGLSGNSIAAADNISSYVFRGSVYFVVVKA